MERYIDLHIHSIYSDGLLSCSQIIAKAKKYRIAVLALCDHQVIDGNHEIASLAKKNNIQVVPGLELYTHYHGKSLHLLGYNFDLKNRALNNVLERLQNEQRKNFEKSINGLQKLGFQVNRQKILQIKSKFPGVLHLLQELERYPKNIAKMKGNLGKNYSFFNKIFYYFSREKPAYLPLSRLKIKDAIKLIKLAKGIPILAHPGQQLTFEQDYIIEELVKEGLKGLEFLSPYHNWRQNEHYQQMCQRLKLAATAGSDFHSDIEGQSIKNQWDYFKAPYSVFLNFKKHLIN